MLVKRANLEIIERKKYIYIYIYQTQNYCKRWALSKMERINDEENKHLDGQEKLLRTSNRSLWFKKCLGENYYHWIRK